MNREQRRKLEQHLANNKKKVEDWLKKDSHHKKPVTRRDFLRTGVIHSLGVMAAPSLFNLFGTFNIAHAAECAAASASAMAPFITINLSGGWSMAGNWMPFDINNNKLPSYTTLAGGTNPNILTAFGNQARFFNNNGGAGSRFIQALRANAGDAVLNNAAFVGVPCKSNDDTGDNRLDASAFVMRAGLVGPQLPNMGTRGTVTGINQEPIFNERPPAPLIASNFNSVAGALGFAGALGQLNATQQARLSKLAMDLSNSQARKLASLSGGENILELVECATGQNFKNMSNGSLAAIDPRQNAAVTPIWTLNNQDQLRDATLVYNCLNGVSGPVGLDRGGYDYHGDDNRANQDQSDTAVGDLVGRILRTAQALNRPAFIVLTSDGAVSSNSATQGASFTSDSGERGCLGFIAFRPNGVPATNGQQIGGFTAGQVANTTFITGNNTSLAMASILLNWGQFSGNMDAVVRALPANTFNAAQIQQVLRIV